MKILIAGDFCPQKRVAELLDKGEYKTVLDDVKQTISDADYSIVNFECPVADDATTAIRKQGPSLRCSEKGVDAVKWVGFDCVTLANNHFLDQGAKGVENTLAACEKYAIDTVGGGRDLKEAANILYKDIEGKKLAIINCCEHEFSIATESSPGSNPLNPIRQYYAIKEARIKADFVVVIVHGGHEMRQLPSPRMKEIYRFFIDAGADAVINHHQHCYSGYEVYKEKPIFYGLGNFCFDRPDRKNSIWNEGYMVQLELKCNEKPTYNLIPYKQCGENPDVILMKEEERKAFEKEIQEINSVIGDNVKLKAEFDKYVNIKYASFSSILSPFNTRFCMGLVRRGYLPNFISKRKSLMMFNRISCESHRDILLRVLNKIIHK